MSVTAKDLFGRSDHTNDLGGTDLVEHLTPAGLAFDQAAITETGHVARDVGLDSCQSSPPGPLPGARLRPTRA